MPKRVTTKEQILNVVSKYDSVRSPELIAKFTGFDDYDVFTIIFNYRFAFKNYKLMDDRELMMLLHDRPKTNRETRD